jgi:flagellar basal-body rod protein FlgB
MFENIGIFKVATGMMSHASARQNVTATNISNAETPGYTAQKVRDFALETPRTPMAMHASRGGHLDAFATTNANGFDRFDTDQPVDLENELLSAAKTQSDHQRAVSVYRSTLGILRTSLGKM